jgi:hypothetical protein
MSSSMMKGQHSTWKLLQVDQHASEKARGSMRPAVPAIMLCNAAIQFWNLNPSFYGRSFRPAIHLIRLIEKFFGSNTYLELCCSMFYSSTMIRYGIPIVFTVWCILCSQPKMVYIWEYLIGSRSEWHNTNVILT